MFARKRNELSAKDAGTCGCQSPKTPRSVASVSAEAISYP